MRLFISYDGRLRKGFRAQRKERADEEVEQYNSFYLGPGQDDTDD